MNIIKIKCAYCGKEFARKAGQYREAVKFGWKQYCSFKCKNSGRVTSKEFVCGNPNCKRKIFKIPSELKKSSSGLTFCSRRCSAIVFNKARIKYNNCANCGKIIRNYNKFCSFQCSVEKSRKPLVQTQSDVLKRLKTFYETNQRIPVKRELPGLYRTARLAFGTWNKAIKKAGFEPNPLLFAKKFIAKDGHTCDSFTEKIIDNWLYDKKISHERNSLYKNTKLTADFKVSPKIIIEFFGLAGVQKNYDRIIERKRKECRKRKINLIEIYPKDMYPKNTLSRILKNLL